MLTLADPMRVHVRQGVNLILLIGRNPGAAHFTPSLQLEGGADLAYGKSWAQH